jgi:hypothetical protein
MKKFYINIAVALLILGCTNVLSVKNKKGETQSFLLTNDSVKYWCETRGNSIIKTYNEAGIALFKNGACLNYENDYKKSRVIIDFGSIDIFCDTSKFWVKSDTLYLERCEWTFVFKIQKLTVDTLELKEISNYGFYPDDIPIVFVESKDQSTIPTTSKAKLEKYVAKP